MRELRLLTYNVRSLRDDGDAVAAVIRACRPDVVAVQEAPRALRWRSKRAALARTSGLVVATADREGGLFVMTSLAVRVRSTSFALLPRTRGLHQRAVCVADVSLRGADWRVACIHLGLDAGERQRHLDPLWRAVGVPAGVAVAGDSAGDAAGDVAGNVAGNVAGEAAVRSLVVAGDVNEGPGAPAWDALSGRLTDAWAAANPGAGPADGHTFSTRRRRMRIDGVFTDAEVVSCEVVTDLPDAATVHAASDHYPLLAVLRPCQQQRGL